MATIFDLRDDINTALAALSWVILPTSDYRTDLDSIPEQTVSVGAHAQIRTQYERIDEQTDANIAYDIVLAEIVIIVREKFDDERLFTDTVAETWSHHSTARPLRSDRTNGASAATKIGCTLLSMRASARGRSESPQK